MPTYDYRCESCGHRFDVWQRMTDDPMTVCPKCAGHVRRVIHPAGIVFKGAGFYVTDTRNGSSTAAGAASTTSEPATAASTSGESSSGSSEASGTAASAPAGSASRKAAS